MSPITVALTPEYEEIWQTCKALGHEMIVTTKIRRIFPTMEFQISGLEATKSYKLSMQFEHSDNLKYRFDKTLNQYTSSTSTHPKNPPKMVFHLRGTRTGSEWMSESISFDNIRITCTKKLEAESENYVHLLSGHRYQPVLTIHENDEPVNTARIDHMTFIVVTMYHRDGIRKYKASINKFSTKSEGEQKVGILCRKRSSAPATLESSIKQLRIQNDDEPSTSGAGPSGAGFFGPGLIGAGPSGAGTYGSGISGSVPRGSVAPLFHLSLGTSFDSRSHPVVLSTPPITPAEDPVEQKTSATPKVSKFIKSEPFSPPITPEFISTSMPSTSEAQMILEVTPMRPRKIRAASPESEEPRSIKSEVETPSEAAPVPPEFIEVPEPRPVTPEVQVIQEVAPNAPDRPVRLGAVQALRPPTPVSENIQEEAPGAPQRQARPFGIVPLRELALHGFPMMFPMMPMMPFGMVPYPINWNPMMFPVQPPAIPQPNQEENNENEVEFINIID